MLDAYTRLGEEFSNMIFYLLILGSIDWDVFDKFITADESLSL